MDNNAFIQQLQTNIIDQLKIVSLSGINQSQAFALRTQIKVLHEYVVMETITTEKYLAKYNAILKALEVYEQDEKLFDEFGKNYYTKIKNYFGKLIDWFALEISTYNGVKENF